MASSICQVPQTDARSVAQTPARADQRAGVSYDVTVPSNVASFTHETKWLKVAEHVFYNAIEGRSVQGRVRCTAIAPLKALGMKFSLGYRFRPGT
jgi:hypothetical protein